MDPRVPTEHRLSEIGIAAEQSTLLGRPGRSDLLVRTLAVVAFPYAAPGRAYLPRLRTGDPALHDDRCALLRGWKRTPLYRLGRRTSA